VLDAKIQTRFFEHGLQELIENVNQKLRKRSKNTDSLKPQKESITHLFTFDGIAIKSLIDIP